MRWNGFVQVTLDSSGSGTGTIAGPRLGYVLSITGGTVQGIAAGGPTLTLYNSIEALGTQLVALQVGALNTLSGDGQTQLHGGETIVAKVTGGAKGGTVNVTLNGTLERF